MHSKVTQGGHNLGLFITSEMGLERRICSEQEPQEKGTIAFTRRKDGRASMSETDLWFLVDTAARLPVQFSLDF